MVSSSSLGLVIGLADREGERRPAEGERERRPRGEGDLLGDLDLAGERLGDLDLPPLLSSQALLLEAGGRLAH